MKSLGAPLPLDSLTGAIEIKTDNQREQREQRQKSLLGCAADRVREEAKNRECKYLRPFNAGSEGYCRTNQRRWNSLAQAIEPILARLDFATMQLGYINKKTKQFHVDRQRGIAKDSGLQESALSRLMKHLADAGYISRKARRIRNDGEWITRTTIKIRDSFFSDLGLGPALRLLRDDNQSPPVKVVCRQGDQQV